MTDTLVITLQGHLPGHGKAGTMNHEATYDELDLALRLEGIECRPLYDETGTLVEVAIPLEDIALLLLNGVVE